MMTQLRRYFRHNLTVTLLHSLNEELVCIVGTTLTVNCAYNYSYDNDDDEDDNNNFILFLFIYALTSQPHGQLQSV
jgi:hypothetical protein